MRISEFIRRVEREGWTVRQRNGGHLELSHPLADQMILMSASPSDHRWAANTLARMKRALPSEPRPERAERRVKRRPAPRPKPRPAPVLEMEEEELPLPVSARRIAGGPQAWRSPWSRLW
jgi:predicted RNA binding protein YcfA (HicA-like mRNA interferase family)